MAEILFKDGDGYGYNPGRSMAGIVYSNDTNIPEFHPLYETLRHPPFLPPGSLPSSSSHGLVSWYDSATNLYQVGNPFVPDAYEALPPAMNGHDLNSANAVLVVYLGRPFIYHLICAIRNGQGDYTFDTYTSARGRWRSHRYRREMADHDLVPNSGVSLNESAFWLTESPNFSRSVYEFHGYTGRCTFLSWLPEKLQALGRSENRIQLGRIRNNLALAVVAANGATPTVELYFVYPILKKVEKWPNILRLTIHNGVDWNRAEWLLLDGNHFYCKELPRLVRFESYKMQVLLSVDGRRIVLWENNIFDYYNTHAVLLPGNLGSLAADGFGQIRTELLPRDFPRFLTYEQDVEGDADTDENAGDHNQDVGENHHPEEEDHHDDAGHEDHGGNQDNDVQHEGNMQAPEPEVESVGSNFPRFQTYELDVEGDHAETEENARNENQDVGENHHPVEEDHHHDAGHEDYGGNQDNDVQQQGNLQAPESVGSNFYGGNDVQQEGNQAPESDVESVGSNF